MRRADATMTALFDDMLEGVQLIDPDYRYRYVNPAAARQGQRSREELVGRRMTEMYPGIEASDFFRLLERCMEDREQQRMINHFPFPDGTWGWFELRLTPVPEGVLIFSADITELKRVENELRASVSALEEADKRKSELLTMLAHELRNPLVPVRNALHVLTSRLASDDGLGGRAAEMAERQLKHLARIVDDLVDTTRLVSGKVTLTCARLDLGRLVREVAVDQGPAFEEAGVAIVIEAPETPVWVSADDARLAQALGNVLDNARKFSDRGSSVSVLVRRAGDTVTVDVRDTGIGIDGAALARVFEPLFQADTSLERARGGLGVGLSTAKGIVELHGGAIVAASEGAGRGAAFRISLPALAEAPVVTSRPVPSTTTAERRVVLVIEDNKDAARTLEMILGLWGFTVRVSHDGHDGVAQARAARPDVVLCDIGLPGLDGYAVARTLRADAATRRARMIAITGYGREQDHALAIAAGFDVHLAKPVNPEFLRTQL